MHTHIDQESNFSAFTGTVAFVSMYDFVIRLGIPGDPTQLFRTDIPMCSIPRVIPIACLAFIVSAGAAFADKPSTALAENTSTDVASLVQQVVKSAGGKENLLTIFKMEERLNPGPKRKEDGKLRTSTFKLPGSWWLGKRERGDEPAKIVAWAWTLGILVDSKSKIETIPDVKEGETELMGLRVTESVTPELDMYFDKKDHRLMRVDWRKDIYLFTEWKTFDGTRHPAKCVMLRKATRKPWFHHEILKMERLSELPDGLK